MGALGRRAWKCPWDKRQCNGLPNPSGGSVRQPTSPWREGTQVQCFRVFLPIGTTPDSSLGSDTQEALSSVQGEWISQEVLASLLPALNQLRSQFWPNLCEALVGTLAPRMMHVS